MTATDKARVNWVRKYAPGYVGGAELCNRATDSQVFALIYWHDELAKAHARQAQAGNMIKHIEQSIETGKNIGI